MCRALLDRGHTVVVVTGAPARMILRELPSPRLAIRKASLDFGAKQKDAFSVDMLGAPRTWADWLHLLLKQGLGPVQGPSAH